MLDDAAIERFARQIVVPGIGAEGQDRICRSRLVITGEATGVAHAQVYARAAGFSLNTETDQPPACLLVAGTRSLDSYSLEGLRSFAVPILWYSLDDEAIVAGTVAVGGSLDPLLLHARGSARNELRHALAAADLVAAAIGLVLAWTDVEPAYRLELP